MNLILVGASAGLGRALADKLAAAGHNLLLVASNKEDLDALAADLQIRHQVKAITAAWRLKADKESVEKVQFAAKEFAQIDGLLFPIGYSQSDDDGSLQALDIERIVDSNLSVIMALTAVYLPEIIQRGAGLLVFFGSVAAERGRSSNIAYAAAKRGLLSFYESIRHRCASTDVRVQYYQLGYLKTAQTLGKKLPFPAADPADAAAHIVSRLKSGSFFSYYPGFWCLICLALRLTPWFIFKKLKF